MRSIFFVMISLFTLCSCDGSYAGTLNQGTDLKTEKPEGYPSDIFAGGCFWCLESEFRALDGVLFTRSGYTAGHLDNPDYDQVTTGTTGHAEAVEITYDPDKISYEDLVDFFLTKAHDPTQLNRQGVDVGPQYRSALYYKDDDQKKIIEEAIARVNASGQYKDPVVTEVARSGQFWEAEEYHQQYYEKYEERTGQPHVRVLYKQKEKQSAGH